MKRLALALALPVALLTLPAAADAAEGCSYDAGSKTATYTWPTTAGSTIPSAQVSGGAIKLGTAGAACGAATTGNTDTILVSGAPPTPSGSNPDFIFLTGPLTPGSVDEGGGSSEIEIVFQNPTRKVRVAVAGTSSADHFTAGTDGINLNADESTPDADVTATGANASIYPIFMGCGGNPCGVTGDPGSAGADVIKTNGGSGTGGAIGADPSLPLKLFGGPGADTLTVSGDGSVDGGPDDDILTGPSPVGGAFVGAFLDYAAESAAVNVDLVAGTATGTSIGSDTISGFGNVKGTRFADTLKGNDEVNVIEGYGFVDPDAGDTIEGRGGDDFLSGDAGDDNIDGGAGKDDIDGGDGGDTVHGGSENDSIRGGADNDDLFGDAGDDDLAGQLGDDELGGGDGTDSYNPSAATAGITVDLAAGTATGGLGSDAIASIENVNGTKYSDTLSGTDGPDTLTGGFDSGGTTNKDTINGRGGNDLLAIYSAQGGTIDGGPGSDNINGGAGPDTLSGPADGVRDSINCAGGTDVAASYDLGLDELRDCEGGTGTQPGGGSGGGGGGSAGAGGGSGGGGGGGGAADTTAPKITHAAASNKKTLTVTKKGAFTISGFSYSEAVSGSAAAKGKVKKKTVSFGSVKFKAASGKAAKVTFKLSKANLKALKKAKKLKLTITFTATDAAGNKVTKTLTVTLKAPKR